MSVALPHTSLLWQHRILLIFTFSQVSKSFFPLYRRNFQLLLLFFPSWLRFFFLFSIMYVCMSVPVWMCMSRSVRESLGVSGCGCVPAHSAVSVTGSRVDFSRLGKEISYRLIWHSVLMVMQVAVSWSQRAWWLKAGCTQDSWGPSASCHLNWKLGLWFFSVEVCFVYMECWNGAGLKRKTETVKSHGISG